MAKLIDKDALVAEIKRLQGVLQDPAMNRESMQDYAHGGNKIIKEILSFLNTLEVKEVDIEKEATRFVQTKEFAECEGSPVLCIAKHFFELGLKVNNEKEK